VPSAGSLGLTLPEGVAGGLAFRGIQSPIAVFVVTRHDGAAPFFEFCAGCRTFGFAQPSVAIGIGLPEQMPPQHGLEPGMRAAIRTLVRRSQRGGCHKAKQGNKQQSLCLHGFAGFRFATVKHRHSN
jgi:hypothetical protein